MTGGGQHRGGGRLGYPVLATDIRRSPFYRVRERATAWSYIPGGGDVVEGACPPPRGRSLARIGVEEPASGVRDVGSRGRPAQGRCG